MAHDRKKSSRLWWEDAVADGNGWSLSYGNADVQSMGALDTDRKVEGGDGKALFA